MVAGFAKQPVRRFFFLTDPAEIELISTQVF